MIGEQKPLGAGLEDLFAITANSCWLVTTMPMAKPSALKVSLDDAGELVGNAASGWTFSPAANFNGKVDHHTISDGSTEANGADVTNSFRILGVNDALIFTATSATALRNGSEDNTVVFSEIELLSGFSDLSQPRIN